MVESKQEEVQEFKILFPKPEKNLGSPARRRLDKRGTDRSAANLNVGRTLN